MDPDFIQKYILTDFHRRIGTAPSLSLGTTANHAHTSSLGTHNRNTSSNGLPFDSLAGPMDFNRPATAASSTYGATMPPMSNKAREAAGYDEFGYKNPSDLPSVSANTAPTRTPQQQMDDFVNRPAEPRPVVAGRRPNSSTGRFTIANLDEKDHRDRGASPPATARIWLPAEEEKKRLYERATADVARVQGDAAHPVSLS